jgi:hypothetical protein
MELLKIGQRFINMDLVTDAEARENEVIVFLTAPTQSPPNAAYGTTGGTEARQLVFTGDEARILDRWLTSRAKQPTKMAAARVTQESAQNKQPDESADAD